MLPSPLPPLPPLPFCLCAVKHFTLALIFDSPKCDISHMMNHPDWTRSTWRLVRKVPILKVVSLIWKIGTNRMLRPQCNLCNCEATTDHIVFTCPIVQPLWREFDRVIGAVVGPSFKLIFGGLDRRFADLDCRPDSPMVSMLEFLHIHFAWCTWWAHFHGNDVQSNERWSRRVMNLYSLLDPEVRRDWNKHPFVSRIIREWKY